jgi:cytochrome c2
MQTQGGSVYASASTVSVGGNRTNGFNKFEGCMTCHGSGRPQDIKVMHAK